MKELTSDPLVEPKKKRSGWWFLAKLMGALLALTIGTLWLWVRSDGDLRAAREAISAAGFPTTGKEMGRKKSDEARIAAWKRLDELFSKKALLGEYYSQLNGFAVPSTPLPETLSTYVAALPPSAVAEALALIDELGDAPVVHDESFTMATRVPVISKVPYFVSYHALLSPAADLPDDLIRLVRLARWCNPQSGHIFSSQQSIASRLTQILLYRRADLSTENRRRFADLLLTLTANPGRSLAQAQAGALVLHLDFFINPDDRMRRGGMMAPDLFQWPVIGSLYFRAGRGAFLQSELDWAIFLRDHRDDLRAIRAEAQRRQPIAQSWTLLLNPGRWLSLWLSQTTQPYLSDGLARTRLRAELVAAVLRDEPWPVDWFDPTGARLRPITIDGQVMGAYSVGPDGRDDGGTSNKDTRWALFGPIDPPKP